jgi:uncharacterized Rmd1/YagE family protein
MGSEPSQQQHSFWAAAFVQNLSLKDLAPLYPNSKRTPHELRFSCERGGEVFIYPFGVVVFLDVADAAREAELALLGRARPGLTWPAAVTEEFAARTDPEAVPHMADGVLTLDSMTPARASVIALIVAQSAAMEYYERIVEEMFSRTDRLVERLQKSGTVAFGTRQLHRFIGFAVGTRHEVISVLHLLDKPDEAWEDPGIDRIYDRLRAEFDLVDRYQALEMKLRAVQDSLELVLDAARDRRLVLLESAIVVLIIFEIVLSLVRA